MLIIGLGCYSRVGKDTLASYIVECAKTNGIPVKKVSFAAKLKDICHQIYGWAGLQDADFYETKDGELLRDETLPALGLTPVEIWCKVGTDAFRDTVYDDTWVDYVLHSEPASEGITIITDVRFPNEADALKRQGAYLIKVVRPGYGPKDTIADQALVGFDEWDHIAGSSGELGDLAALADEIVRWVHTADDTLKPQQTEEEREAAHRVEFFTGRVNVG